MNKIIGNCLQKISLPESANITTSSRVQTPIAGIIGQKSPRSGGATPMLNPMSPRSPPATIIPTNIPKRTLDVDLLDFSLTFAPHLLGVGGREVREIAAAALVQEPESIIAGIDVGK
jgi:hypothetical protein